MYQPCYKFGGVRLKIITSFVLVGLICAMGSIIYDTTKLSPGHITSLFVVIGTVLGFLGVYDILIKQMGYGLTLPIVSFGNSLYKAAYDGFKNNGFFGVFMNLYKTTSAGISMTIFLSFVVSIFCKPKD